MKSQRRLLISPRAVDDLHEIADYIARDNPIRAASFVAELEAKCRAVAASPDIYPARPDLAQGVRMAVHRRYIVFYRDLPGKRTVCIERVLHGARDLRRPEGTPTIIVLPSMWHSTRVSLGRFVPTFRTISEKIRFPNALVTCPKLPRPAGSRRMSGSSSRVSAQTPTAATGSRK